jgi:hypothetical protein
MAASLLNSWVLAYDFIPRIEESIPPATQALQRCGPARQAGDGLKPGCTKALLTRSNL